MSNENWVARKTARARRRASTYASLCVALAIAVGCGFPLDVGESSQPAQDRSDPVLDWNQILVDTLIATNTANAASQRLSAIVQSAVFDAYNGIERRYQQVLVSDEAPRGASKRAAVIQAAYKTLWTLFPTRRTQLDAARVSSLAALSDDGEDGGEARIRGIEWGDHVADAILAWRAADGFNDIYPAFLGGTAVGQWRPTPPSFTAMSAQSLAFTNPFLVESTAQFRPPLPRGLDTATYTDDFNTVKALGRKIDSTRTAEQTALAPFWEYNASIHWNQAANQIARVNGFSLSDNARFFAVLNIAMADTAFTTWSAKRTYGADPGAVTWRPVTAIPLADFDDNPDTVADPDWLPLVNTPSHPEYPAGHPSQNGAAAAILLSHVDDAQTFTLTAGSLPNRTYTSITQARSDGNNARIWGGMHYPSTIAASDAEGEAIARYIHETKLQSIHGIDRSLGVLDSTASAGLVRRE